jgi:hypothetical protein
LYEYPQECNGRGGEPRSAGLIQRHSVAGTPETCAVAMLRTRAPSTAGQWRPARCPRHPRIGAREIRGPSPGVLIRRRYRPQRPLHPAMSRVHIPKRTVHIPSSTVHIPKRTVHIPKSPVRIPSPPFISQPARFISQVPRFISPNGRFISHLPRFISQPARFISQVPPFIFQPARFISPDRPVVFQPARFISASAPRVFAIGRVQKYRRPCGRGAGGLGVRPIKAGFGWMRRGRAAGSPAWLDEGILPRADQVAAWLSD